MGKVVTAAEAMIEVALQLEGVHEVGFDNRGPLVEELQAHDDIPGGGYAWCMAEWQAVADYLGLHMPSKSASVGIVEEAFRKAGWLNAGNRPWRGSLGFWRIDADTWPDHVFGVTKVVSLGGELTLETIEGNTSPGSVGSQANGGGCYQCTRVIPAGQVTFGTFPGTVTGEALAAAIAHVRQLRGFRPLTDVEKRIAREPTSKPPDEALYWLWLRWDLGEGEFKDTTGHFLPRRPKALPERIPAQWKARRDAFVAARNH
jgi:hypothetical protein